MEKKFADIITREEISELPQCKFPGEIIIVDDEPGLKNACAYLSKQPTIGFDTETRPSFKAGVTNRVALIQLSSREKCYLIRLCNLRMERSLTKILENRDVIKVGADVKNDLRGLQTLRRFKAEGFMDLQSIVAQWGISEKSVRKMAAIILNCRISKAQRLSNWEAARLTPAQQMYAATDAWICLEMYNMLMGTSKIEE